MAYGINRSTEDGCEIFCTATQKLSFYALQTLSCRVHIKTWHNCIWPNWPDPLIDEEKSRHTFFMLIFCLSSKMYIGNTGEED